MSHDDDNIVFGDDDPEDAVDREDDGEFRGDVGDE